MNTHVINYNTHNNMKSLLFPDNQTHVTLLTDTIKTGDEAHVICSITNSNDMMKLLQISNAMDHMFVKKLSLSIPYLLGARSDRVMIPGDSVDLQVYSKLINSMNFMKVYLYDVHSDVSLMLINNSCQFTNRNLVEVYDQSDAVLICPDAGAAKKTKDYFIWNENLKEEIMCVKKRDLYDQGKITLKVLESEKCKDRNCVIIDDLCDGGGTFLQIAQQIQPKHLTLIVTHSIFSKGTAELTKTFDNIITSDSYCHIWNSPKITQLKHPLDGSIFNPR